MAKMKPGETFHIDAYEIVKSMENRVLDITLEGGETTHVRIVDVSRETVMLKVIPRDVRE